MNKNLIFIVIGVIIVGVIAALFVFGGNDEPTVSPQVSSEDVRRPVERISPEPAARLRQQREAAAAEEAAAAAETERSRVAAANRAREVAAVQSRREERAEDSRLEVLRDELVSLIGAENTARWYPQDQPVQRLLTILSAFADGRISAKHVAFLHHGQPFVPRQDAPGRFYLSEASYRRFSPLVYTLTDLNPVRIADLIRRLERPLNRLYHSLGFSGDVRTALNSSFDRALQAPVLDRPPSLVRPSVHYRYADRRLEGLDAVSKQLIRMGPENTRRLQSWVRDLRKAL